MKEVLVFVSAYLVLITALDYQNVLNQHPEVIQRREKAVKWLFSVQEKSWGWGKVFTSYPETHRVLTTLALTNATNKFEHGSLDYQLSYKQLELELSLALLKKEDSVTAGQLALYINALLTNCQDPHDFYSHDIIVKMKNKQKISIYEEALVSLSLCNSGHRLSKQKLQRYLNLIDDENATLFIDTKAMLCIALSCARNSHEQYRFIDLYLHQPLKSFKKKQTSEGNFGNIYTTGLVVQALIAADDKGYGWNFDKSIDYILSQQKEDGSFTDLLATYFVLPVLSGESFTSIRNIKCEQLNQNETDNLNQNEKDNLNQNETDDNVEELQSYIAVNYSLWSEYNITKLFFVPENSTFFDVMKIAQKEDHRYRFKVLEFSWGYFVESIGGVTNVAKIQCYKHWMLYKSDSETGELISIANDVSKEYPQDGDHYVFRYQITGDVKSCGESY